MHTFNFFYSEKIQKQQYSLESNRQQLMDYHNRLQVQSEPKLRTNKLDRNINFDQQLQPSYRQNNKENTLIFKTKDNQLREFPFYYDSNVGVNENFQKFVKETDQDYDIETSQSDMDEGIYEGISDLNYAIRKFKYLEQAETSIQNKQQKGLMDHNKKQCSQKKNN